MSLPFIYWSQTWSPLSLQMAWHLTVPGHQQAQCWLQSHTFFSDISLVVGDLNSFLLNWWCHSKWPTKSQEISRSFGTSSVNSLWPSDYIWCHKSELTLTRVKGYSLTAPRQYLNQCWLRINGIYPSVISQMHISHMHKICWQNFI